MDATAEALTPKFNAIGLMLAIVGGAVTAVIGGYLYFLLANKAQIDYIIIIAALLGALVGAVVGAAARIGRLRVPLIVLLIAFVFGVGGYAARYFFEYNDTVSLVAESQGVSRDEILSRVSFADYLQFVTEGGFTISGQSSDSNAPIQGSMAWGLLGIEALAAGFVAAATARSALKGKTRAPAPGQSIN